MKKIDEKEAFRQAFAYLKKGDARLCINTCRGALIHYPENINLLCLISRASMAVRLFEDAQGFLNEATRLNPKSPIARETYGDLLLVQGKAEEAIREYLFVKELNPGEAHPQIRINQSRLIPIVRGDFSFFNRPRVAFVASSETPMTESSRLLAAGGAYPGLDESSSPIRVVHSAEKSTMSLPLLF